jgi:CspA family cold shock protein
LRQSALVACSYSTPVRSADLAEELRSIAKQRRPDGPQKAIQAFVGYCLNQDRSLVAPPLDEIYDGQRQLRLDLEARWVGLRSAEASKSDEADIADQAPAGWSQVTAIVKWYNSDKGYGFAVGRLGEDVFIHHSALQQAEIAFVESGDSLVCDIALGPRGKLQVIAVHSVQHKGGDPSRAATQEFVQGVVEFYDGSKGYGFVKSARLPEDVFVAARVLDQAGLRTLPAGARVRMKIEPGRLGRGYMASSIELVTDDISEELSN